MQAVAKCGIVGKYGLLTEKGSLVPLKDVSVEITISGFVAHVVSSLQYENKEDTPVEAEFTFPLDDGSAVYKFEAFIEDRHIIAECQNKEEARQTYVDAIDDGSTVMLLEEDDTAGDIFRCLVGNLPPKTVSNLVIGYVIELPVEHDGKLRFTLPVILNPRYSPNVCGIQSAQGAMYVVKQQDIPYTFKLSATVEGSKEVKAVTASQPNIEIDYSESRKNVMVLFNDDFTFDADVRLYVEYENPYELECLVESGNQEKSGFLADAVLMVNLFTNIDTVGTTSKGEYIFVLDRSSSMGYGTSSRIKHAKEALVLFLKSLPVGCYFNIVSFGSSHIFLFDSGSKEYTEENLSKALSEVKKMEADMGGTEILNPLNDIYKKDNMAGHSRQIFLLTDGETGNTDTVIQVIKNNCLTTRVFSIGIGDGASTAFVNGLARAGNGKAEIIKDSERIQPKVVSLLKFAMQPSISDVKIGWELPTGVSAMTIPEAPPCLLNGERLILYSLLQGNTQSQISGKVFINGKTDKAPVNISANFFYDKSAAVSSFAPLHRLAAKTQIKLLEDKDDYREESKQQIIDLSVASNMVSKHTSFVAIDKERRLKVVGKHVKRNVPIRMGMGMDLSKASAYCGSIPSRPKRLRKLLPTRNYVVQSNSQIQSNVSGDCAVFCCATKIKVSDDDQENSRDMPVAKSGDDMMDIICMQAFRGNWSLSPDVCKALKVDIKVLKGLDISKDDDVLATLAVLVWLEVNYKGQHDEWEMIETKALTWLNMAKMDDLTVKENMKSIQDAVASSMKV